MLRLLDFLFPPRTDEVTLRTVSTETFLALMNVRLAEKTSPATTALLPFPNAAVRAAIHEAKYHGNEHALALLGAALARYLLDSGQTGAATYLVPVPLGAARRRERGFNQVEEVARRAAALSGVHVDTSLLVRTRETHSQVSLPRQEREENMRDAFATTHAPVGAHHYLVLDDVLTTGATLQAALDPLIAAGATHVSALALAH